MSAWLNQAQQRGGGFYIDGTGQVTVTDSSLFADTSGTVWSNTAGWDGGGFHISGVTATVGGLRIWWNTANGDGGGVSIANAPNQVLFGLNQINWNSANNGGGVDAYNATQLSLGLNTLVGIRSDLQAAAHGFPSPPGCSSQTGSGPTPQALMVEVSL